jgi:DNA-binding response OmpR family regulator
MPEVLTVLIVEDDFESRTLFRVIAQREGFRVLTAEDGAEALALLARERIDILLLDLLLPKINGFEIMRHLRCTRPELLGRTLVMTAATEATTRDCEDLLRVFCFRRKPMEIQEVATDLVACARQSKRQPPHAVPPRAPLTSRRAG